MRRQKISGVYAIWCSPTGAVYIGSSTDIYRRWWDHRHLLDERRHYNLKLQTAWCEHGARAFVFKILAEVDGAALAAAEAAFLELARTCGDVLNASNNAGAGRGCRRRTDLVLLDWSSVDWKNKGDRLIARELGCSAIAVRDRRPVDARSPGSSSDYLSNRAKARLALLTEEQRLERGRRLYASRSAEGEANRIAASRRAKNASRRPCVYLRGSVYYAHYYSADGRMIRRSTGCTEQLAAESELQNFMSTEAAA